MANVPPELAAVLEPLREADEYARLQAIRQRGLYNLLTGLPGFLFVAPTWIQLIMWNATRESLRAGTGNPWMVYLTIATWTAFFISCYTHRLLLPFVRRRRPDWQSPLLESNPLKKALEKQFWIQFPFWIGSYGLFLLVNMIFFFSHWNAPVSLAEFRMIWMLNQVAGAAILVAAQLTLAWQARRRGDGWLAITFLAWLPLGLLAIVFDPGSQQPSPLFGVLYAAALTTPPIVAGLVRLLAPRRWLV